MRQVSSAQKSLSWLRRQTLHGGHDLEVAMACCGAFRDHMKGGYASWITAGMRVPGESPTDSTRNSNCPLAHVQTQWNACCAVAVWLQSPLSSSQHSQQGPDSSGSIVPALLQLTSTSLNFKVRLHAVTALQALQPRHCCSHQLLAEILEQLKCLAGAPPNYEANTEHRLQHSQAQPTAPGAPSVPVLFPCPFVLCIGDLPSGCLLHPVILQVTTELQVPCDTLCLNMS